MGGSLELSEFWHGTLIGYHLFNKSSHEISALLNFPQSTVSGIIIVEVIRNDSNKLVGQVK